MKSRLCWNKTAYRIILFICIKSYLFSYINSKSYCNNYFVSDFSTLLITLLIKCANVEITKYQWVKVGGRKIHDVSVVLVFVAFTTFSPNVTTNNPLSKKLDLCDVQSFVLNRPCWSEMFCSVVNNIEILYARLSI